ncbi:hypothetical protein L596_014350 [Steinernema carpocapsae]|uniref:Major facilitator superfamily (MFS) profile domain-containing protein n=1 Tax=Steinernema carpocapsae TaxID=34508 RepID=A0A4U5NBW1_STECR|nr:hypothetical protein L596_014350 [Steinernema carpocapsae]
MCLIFFSLFNRRFRFRHKRSLDVQRQVVSFGRFQDPRVVDLRITMTQTSGSIGTKTKKVPKPTDGGWSWLVVLGSFLVHVFTDGIVYSFGVLVGTLKKEYKGQDAAASAIVSVLVGLTLSLGPFASIVTEKFGCRLTAIAGSLIATVGCVASYYAHSIGLLIFTMGCIMGVGFSLLYCPAIVIVSQHFEKRRGLATGIAVCGASVGTLIFPPIINFFVDSEGRGVDFWKYVYVFDTIVVFACAFCGLLFYPPDFVEVREDGSSSKSKKTEEADDVEAQNDQNPEGRKTVLSQVKNGCGWMMKMTKEAIDFTLFCHPVFMVYAVSNFVTCLGFNAPAIFITDHGKLHGVDRSTVGWLLSIFGGFNGLGRVVFGFIGDRPLCCPIWKNTARNRYSLYIICMVICGVATITCAWCISFVALAVYAAIFGAALGGVVCLTSCVLVDFIGINKFTSAFGLLLLFQGIGTFVGPPIAGALADITKENADDEFAGHYTWAFLFSGATLLISGPMLFVIPCLPNPKITEVQSKKQSRSSTNTQTERSEGVSNSI